MYVLCINEVLPAERNFVASMSAMAYLSLCNDIFLKSINDSKCLTFQ